MSAEEDTFNALKRTPFEVLLSKIAFGPVSQDVTKFIIDNGWVPDEFWEKVDIIISSIK